MVNFCLSLRGFVSPLRASSWVMWPPNQLYSIVLDKYMIDRPLGVFGIRLLQPIQAIINKSHLGRLGASLIVANLPAWRCGWHRQAWDGKTSTTKGDGPNFSRQPSLRNQRFGGSRNPTNTKTMDLASTCRCDLRKTANKLSLRVRTQVTRAEVSYLSKPSGNFFHEQWQKLIGVTWN